MTGVDVAMAVMGALLLLGVIASKASSRLGVPGLILFLAVGMLAGSDGPGGIEFEDYAVAQTVGIVALAFILFAGGLSTRWDDVRPAARRGVLLATVGVVLTAGVSGSLAALVLDVPLLTGLLLGSIISSTDAAAVFGVLRGRSLGIRGGIRPLLELESGINDPMAVFLATGLITLIEDPSASVASLLPLFVQQLAVGAFVGTLVARATVLAINRLRLDYEGLYPVVTLSVVVFTYGVTDMFGGSGFLAVYLVGLLVGRADILHKKSLARFHDALGWLAQISMFLVLGLLAFPSQLLPIAGRALVVSALLVLVALPVAVFASLWPTRPSIREMTLVSWVGLRGAVPIVVATFPLVAGIPHAETIFDVVFFIVLTSVLVQGTTIPAVARLLGLDAPVPVERAYPLEYVGPESATTGMHELEIHADSPAAGRRILELGLPSGALVVLLNRGGQSLVPEGSTVLHPGDTVLVLADHTAVRAVRAQVEGRPDG